jgi:hypothetical protein
VFCPVDVAHGAGHAADEKKAIADVNDVFAPFLNAGRAQPRYWDNQHAASPADEDGDAPFFYLLRCQLVDLLHPNFIARSLFPFLSGVRGTIALIPPPCRRYMKTGQFTAVSVGASIDRHNVAAIVPLGINNK